MMFLARQKLTVPAEKVDEEIERLKQKLKSEGQDLATALLQSNMSMDDVRKQIEERRPLERVSQDARRPTPTLRKFVADHRDLFRGTQVRASHILLKVEPNASEAEKEKSGRSSRASRKRSRGARSVSRRPPTSTPKIPPTPAVPAAISTTSRSTRV